MSGTAQAVQVATVVVRLKDLTNDDLPAAISQFVLERIPIDFTHSLRA